MNNWSFTGNIGQDCVVAATPAGKTIAEFSVAVTSGYGEYEKTTWASCKIFGARAEGKLPGFLVKGQKVAISGEMTLRTWDKQEGGTGSKVEVVVGSLDLIGEKLKQDGSQPQARPPQSPPQDKKEDFPNEDIPW